MPLYHRAYVEITNRCNRHCDFCISPGRPPAHMAVEVFSLLLDRLGPWVSEVALHVLGEPLVHPRFDRIVEECARHEMPIHLTTNGTLIHRWQTELLSPSFRQLNVSLHALDPDHDGPVLGRLWDFCQKALEERPDLYINLRLWDRAQAQGTDERPESQWLLDTMATTFGVTIPSGGDVAWRKSRRLVGRLYVHRDTRFQWPTGSGADDRGTCLGLKSHFGVLVDGTVIPCCLDGTGRMPLGNLTTESLQEILAGPRATAIRTGFDQGRVIEPTCQGCTFRRRFG